MRQIGRMWLPVAALIVAGAFTLSGCHVRIYDGPYWTTPDGGETYPDQQDPDEPGQVVEDDHLLAVVAPAGGEVFSVGETMPIVWTSTVPASSVTIDLYRYGQRLVSIVRTENDGEYAWLIPPDLDTATEDPDDYRVVIRAEYPEYDPGELYVEARSETFTILPSQSDGLTDVTVSQRLITITVTDNGSQIDGDTVDIILNGETVVAGHVLAAFPGTVIALTLAQGENTLEIVALNEGTVSPNTAELAISNVVEGQALQEWRLTTGERGSLTITAP